MTLNRDFVLCIEARPRWSEYTAAGFYTLTTPHALLLVYDSRIRPRFLIDLNGIYRTSGKAQGFHALKAGVGLVIAL